MPSYISPLIIHFFVVKVIVIFTWRIAVLFLLAPLLPVLFLFFTVSTSLEERLSNLPLLLLPLPPCPPCDVQAQCPTMGPWSAWKEVRGLVPVRRPSQWCLLLARPCRDHCHSALSLKFELRHSNLSITYHSLLSPFNFFLLLVLWLSPHSGSFPHPILFCPWSFLLSYHTAS